MTQHGYKKRYIKLLYFFIKSIFYYILEISPIHKGLFTRASMLVQQHFHMNNFRSQRILIITWKDMKEAGIKVNNLFIFGLNNKEKIVTKYLNHCYNYRHCNFMIIKFKIKKNVFV